MCSSHPHHYPHYTPASRVLAYDSRTALIVLAHEQRGVLVDVALCLGSESGPMPWLVDARGAVTVFGYLERLPVRVVYLSHASCEY
jgi:hypothetical protein